jgi:hypothetical protein
MIYIHPIFLCWLIQHLEMAQSCVHTFSAVNVSPLPQRHVSRIVQSQKKKSLLVASLGEGRQSLKLGHASVQSLFLK